MAMLTNLHQFESYPRSQLYSLLVLSLFRLTAGLAVDSKWPVLAESASLPSGKHLVPRARNGAPAAEGDNFLTLSWEGCNFG
jgi:hypothetical protein